MIDDDVETSAAESTDPLYAWYLDFDTLSAWYDDAFLETDHLSLEDRGTSLNVALGSDINFITYVETEHDLHPEGVDRSSSSIGSRSGCRRFTLA